MDPCKRTGAAGPLQAHGLSWVATFASTATGQCTHLGKARRCTTLLPCCPQEHTVAADPPRWWPGYRRAAQGSTPPAGCERGASTANPHPPPAHMRSRSSYLAETAASSGRRAAASDSAAFGERLACCAVLPPNFPPNAGCPNAGSARKRAFGGKFGWERGKGKPLNLMLDKYKSRCVPMGNRMLKGRDYSESFAIGARIHILPWDITLVTLRRDFLAPFPSVTPQSVVVWIDGSCYLPKFGRLKINL